MIVSELILLIVAAVGSFAISSSAGLGGSLLMVPTMMIVFGPKEGVAMAALLLAMNNVAKLVAYRKTLPIRKSLMVVIVPTVIGSFIGASLLSRAPERWVVTAVMASLAATLVVELLSGTSQRKTGAPLLAGAAGVTSGFSGTSGPLKGVAVRGLGLDRRFTVGAATLASFAGDLTKSLTFAGDGLLGVRQLLIAVACVPLMVGGTVLGYQFNGRLGDDGYRKWFWLIIGAYGLRLAGVLPA